MGAMRRVIFLQKGISTIIVRAKPGDPTKGLLQAGRLVFPCALGRGGISADKREGDGATPLGAMRLLSGYFRRDQFVPGRTPARRCARSAPISAGARCPTTATTTGR